MSPDGVRCAERMDLEVHHIMPYGRGGKAKASNLSLRCQRHNYLEAERVYGRGHMAGKISERRESAFLALRETSGEFWTGVLQS